MALIYFVRDLIDELLQVKMKNRITCQRALFHKWMQVCDWIKGGKFMFNIQCTKQYPKTYSVPCQAIYDKGFLRKFNYFCWKATNIIDVSKGTKYRSSHQKCSLRKGVLRNFTRFTGKHLCQSLFFICVRLATLLKKRLWHRCFPVNFAKFLRTLFLQNTFGRLFLYAFVLSNVVCLKIK